MGPLRMVLPCQTAELVSLALAQNGLERIADQCVTKAPGTGPGNAVDDPFLLGFFEVCLHRFTRTGERVDGADSVDVEASVERRGHFEAESVGAQASMRKATAAGGLKLAPPTSTWRAAQPRVCPSTWSDVVCEDDERAQ